MKRILVLGVLAAGLAMTGLAAAQQPSPPPEWHECPVASVGHDCGTAGWTCVPATCCDDPNGCVTVPPADDGGAGSSGGSTGGSSTGSSGGMQQGTGTPRDCAICQQLFGQYCSATVSCGDAGSCSAGGGGGGGQATTLDGGVTGVIGFGYSTCSPDTGNGDDGGTFIGPDASVGSTSGGSTSGSGGGSTSGGSGGGSTSSGGSNGGSTSSGGNGTGSTGGSSTGSSGGGSGSTGSSGSHGTSSGATDAGSSSGGSNDAGGNNGCTLGGGAGAAGGAFGPLLALAGAALMRRRRRG